MQIKTRSGTILFTTYPTRPKDLSEINLKFANLVNADLCDCKINNTNLSYSFLSGSDLNNANLTYSNLCSAYIRNANLTGANLCGADLCGADFTDSNLEDVVINEWTRVDESTKLDQGQLVYLALRGLKFYEY